MEIHVNNSFCRVEKAGERESEAIKKLLTYKNDIESEKNNLFYKIKYAKSRGNKKQVGFFVKQLKELEKTEWVCWFQEDTFPTGHLNMVKDLLNSINVSYRVIDNRKKERNTQILPWYNKPFDLRYYQKEMLDLGLKEGRGVFEASVGSGKSLVAAYLVKELSVTSMIVVPSRGLLEQLYQDFRTWFGDKKVEIVDTKKARSGKTLKPIRLSTIQTLAALNKKDEVEKALSDVEAIFMDEFHHSASASYTNLLKKIEHIYYRYGFSGTFLRNDNKSMDMWGILSNKLYSYPASKAIEEKFLTPIKIKIHELQGIPSRNYQKEYNANYCGGVEIMERVLHIVSSTPSDKQILILVNRKDKAGLLFHELLNSEGYENSFISGDNKKEVINKTISDFNDKKVRIMIGSSVIGEGIDVRSTDHLIMCQGGKSEIVAVQAVGRALRLYPGKEEAIVHDFHFHGTKYMEKHFKQRIDIYNRNFDPEYIEE